MRETCSGFPRPCAALAGFLAVLVLLSGCRRRELTVDDVASLIAKHEGFPQPVYFTLETGRLDQVTPGAYGTWEDHVKVWTELGRLGYIELEQPSKSPPKSWLHVPRKNVEIRLTDKGRTTFEVVGGDTVRALLCERVLGVIEEIKTSEDGRTAQVTYTWRYANFSPIFDAVLPVSELRDVDFKTPVRETATLKRSDQGWQVVK